LTKRILKRGRDGSREDEDEDENEDESGKPNR
jgi:hypothetical protein